jgi:hypothetical protein
VRAFDLDWTMEQLLRQHARVVGRSGLGGLAPVVRFEGGRSGREVAVGMELFALKTNSLGAAQRPLKLAKIIAPYDGYDTDEVYRFWAVPVADYRRLYRFLRSQLRAAQRSVAPVMHEDDRRRLWDNTIGFLRHGCQQLARYGVPQKRGVLLLGDPGNGKTMACRWLRSECLRHGLEWRSVNAEEFAGAKENGRAYGLFQLDRPGVVVFDDLDMAIRDRDAVGHTADHSTFLGAMDGIDLRHGVVYIFATNACLAELDHAFCRPGRIDVALHFAAPDADLRRRLITDFWHREVVARISVDEVVRQTDGLSFAELEELKKLLVLAHLSDGEWDWSAAWRAFQAGCDDRKPMSFGFARHAFTTTSCAAPVR